MRDMQYERERAEEEQSAIPRGNGWFLRSAAENFQFRYGPIGGVQGNAIIAALYLNANRDRFSVWLADRHIDPCHCLAWVDEKLALLRAIQSMKGFDAEATDRQEFDLNEGAAPRSATEHPGSRPTLHSGYGEAGSQMFAGVFLLENQADYLSWFQEQGIISERPLSWAERQVSDFQQLAGPKLPVSRHPEAAQS